MKKIINQKRYDTDTARKLYSWGNDLGRSDFRWSDETLYQKKTGEFFLHGEGGPMSRYAEHCGHGWTSGEMLIPMTWDEARTWAEERMPVEDYERFFGEIIEEEGKTFVTLSLPVAIAEILKRMAAQSGRTQSGVVAELIRENENNL